MAEKQGNGGREALAEVLSSSLNVDIDEDFMVRIDALLLRLAHLGYYIEETPLYEDNSHDLQD